MNSNAKNAHPDRLVWKELSRETVYKGYIFDLVVSKQESGDGKRGDFTLLECADWANVVALTADGHGRESLVMVRQFRIGGAQMSLEFPGGMIDEGEDPLTAAQRELREETGYVADRWVKIGDINPNPSFMTNRTHSFLATGLHRQSEQDLDELENIDVHLVPVDELESGAHDEFVVNGVMLITWHWFKMWRKKTKNP